MERKIEFLVKYTATGESDCFRVVGRCCGDAIRIGDSFDSIIYYFRDTHDAEGNRLSRRDHPAGFHLRVIRIYAYDQWLDVLGEGMTGTLDLEGTRSELVSPEILGGGMSIAGVGQAQPAPPVSPIRSAFGVPHQEA
jgi:hypothetical protein